MGKEYQLWLVSDVRSAKPRIEVLRNPAKLLASGILTTNAVLWRAERET